MSALPFLYVEGKDDVSIISNLLSRNGIPTDRGSLNLRIVDKGDADRVLDFIPEAIRANTDKPVGFLVDIDAKLEDRWSAICGRMIEVGITMPPAACPDEGYIGQVSDYPHPFGIWLMHDCTTDGGKIEHLIETLIPSGDPLWAFARKCVVQVPGMIAEVNASATADSDQWDCFRDVDRIKAEVHTWLAWTRRPGAPLGAAINDRLLGCDSELSRKLLAWMKRLYGFKPELLS